MYISSKKSGAHASMAPMDSSPGDNGSSTTGGVVEAVSDAVTGVRSVAIATKGILIPYNLRPIGTDMEEGFPGTPSL